MLKDSAGTSLAAMVMIVVMLPCFLVAMYEKHGQPLEVVIKNVIQTKFTRPKCDHIRQKTYMQSWKNSEH